jgi:hypothetical protein
VDKDCIQKSVNSITREGTEEGRGEGDSDIIDIVQGSDLTRVPARAIRVTGVRT